MTAVPLGGAIIDEEAVFRSALDRAADTPEVAAALPLFSEHTRAEIWQAVKNGRADMLRRVNPTRTRMQEVELRMRESEWTARQLSPVIAKEDKELSFTARTFEVRYAELIAQLQEAGVNLPPVRVAPKSFQQLVRDYAWAPERPQSEGGAFSLDELVRQLHNETLSIQSETHLLDEEIWKDFMEPPGDEGGRQVLANLLHGKVWKFLDYYRRFEIAVERRERTVRQYVLLRQGDPEYLRCIAELELLNQSLEDSLLQEAVLPEFRRLFNENLTGRNATRVRICDAPGLRDPQPETPIPTRTVTRVQELMRNMSGMSIGVAGPRGSGKTTIIDGFCSGKISTGPDGELVGVSVSAPVAYDPRDFILHLFGEVCRKVLTLKNVPEEIEGQEEPKSRHAALYRISAASVGGILLAVGITTVARSISRGLPAGSRFIVAVGVVILILAALTVLRRRASAIKFGPPTTADPMRIFSENLSAGFNETPGLQRTIFIHRVLEVLTAALILATSGVLAILAWPVSPKFPGEYLAGCVSIALSALPLQIIDTLRGNFSRREPADRPGGLQPPPWLSACLSWGTVVFLCAGLTMIGLSIPGVPVDLVTVVGCGLALLGWGVLCIVLGYKPPVYLPPYDVLSEDRLVIKSRACLDAIKFQRTFTAERSVTLRLAGTVKLPVGYEAQQKAGMAWSKQAESYPALVDRFREYIGDLGRGHRVIIGIDELDKLGSAETAENFLNDIKGIFGIRGCYFIVSVSEDAAASFHRRGVPYRDVFDSCFDDIVLADYLDHETARDLLYGRVADIPLPFVGLCYALSGGLSRDLIRTARTLAEHAREEIEVSNAAAILCRSEGAAKTRGVQYELSLVQGSERAASLVFCVAEMKSGSTSAAEYFKWGEKLSRWLSDTEKADLRNTNSASQSDRSAFLLAAELSAFYLFLATVLEFFGNSFGKIPMQSVEEYRKYTESLDLLASVRQSLSVNYQVSASRAQEFRHRVAV
ncbi:hypothetical protein [Streptomyces sp. NBC_00203]|uniref:hypothetical protein n=1 Tax=Streptomyces sp. NBC_00203 TaxID=2975680 RepID=UPI003252245C